MSRHARPPAKRPGLYGPAFASAAYPRRAFGLQYADGPHIARPAVRPPRSRIRARPDPRPAGAGAGRAVVTLVRRDNSVRWRPARACCRTSCWIARSARPGTRHRARLRRQQPCAAIGLDPGDGTWFIVQSGAHPDRAHATCMMGDTRQLDLREAEARARCSTRARPASRRPATRCCTATPTPGSCAPTTWAGIATRQPGRGRRHEPDRLDAGRTTGARLPQAAERSAGDVVHPSGQRGARSARPGADQFVLALGRMPAWRRSMP